MTKPKSRARVWNVPALILVALAMLAAVVVVAITGSSRDLQAIATFVANMAVVAISLFGRRNKDQS
jgi:NADH:ubiquinone oxidoreductase subunit 6 (subunit J)